MRKFVIAFAVVLVASGTFAGDSLVRSHLRGGAPQTVSVADLQAKLTALYGSAAAAETAYVGSEFCIACHSGGLANAWRRSKHSAALRRPMARYTLQPGLGVVADYDQNGVDDFMQGLDFNAINSAFDVYKPNAPKLSYEAAGDAYFVTVGSLKMPVVFTQGGTGPWKQRYGVRIPVSDRANGLSAEIYMTPVQYNEATRAYVVYNGGNWYDASNQPKYSSGVTSAQVAVHGGTYSKKCIGCHTTGVRDLSQTASGEWVYKGYVAVLYNADDPKYFDYDGDGNYDIVNVGCEACHGPGGAHILAAGDPSKIVNPAHLTTQQENEVCGQCHVRVFSVPNKTHEWPYNDVTKKSWLPGSSEPLANYYIDAGGYWPDGRTSRQHHQQFTDLYRSTKPTFQFHPVRCTECHRAHSSSIRPSIVEGTLTIPTSVDNNTLCLACHATHGPFEEITKEQVAAYDENRSHIAEVTETHTNHPYGPERSMGLSRCTTCHMPTTATTAVAYDISSHTFEVVPPEKTLKYQANNGMPNACAVSCHATKVNSFGLGLDSSISAWNAKFDQDLATALQRYYGPDGLWWKHAVNAPANPNYVAPSADD